MVNSYLQACEVRNDFTWQVLVFSAMNIMKNKMRNRMGNQWMNDSLITYIEYDIFDIISNDVKMEQFQNMLIIEVVCNCYLIGLLFMSD